MHPRVIRTNRFVGEAADFVLQSAHRALGERDQFRIALSGGQTPRPVYEEIAQRGRDLPWERVFITFSDERCVPPDDAKSNYRMAREALFVPAAVPERSIARMRGELDPHLAAQEYEEELRVLAAQQSERIFRHDLVLLGMGEDGHTASLFPGSAALAEKSRNVVANFAPKLEEWRLTFTFPLIAQARAVCFLLNANKHRELIDKVLGGDLQYPAANITAGEITWILGE